MKISHELPLSLLNHAYKWNDYDYLLPSFYERHEEYRNFFKKARQDGRFIIMDNGLFEGDVYSDEYLIKIIQEIQPNIFIVPDAWNDADTTIKNTQRWKKYDIPENTKLMVVLQGNKLDELAMVYHQCENQGYECFAFNHSSNYYKIFNHPDSLVKQMWGRITLVSTFRKIGLIKDNHYIHLLGCSLPEEFMYYKYPEFNFIKSVDTSNPIINGASECEYEHGKLTPKQSQKLEVFMEKDLTDKISTISWNVSMFRRMCNY